MPRRLASFDLRPGDRIGDSYRVEALLGRGTEGEVYRVRDRNTGIPRAAKLHFPHADPKRRLTARHAQKMERLRACPIALQVHHSERVRVGDVEVVALVSELCEGEPLSDWLERQRGGRVEPFLALCILRDLAVGLEQIHAAGEYHADVHTANVLIRRYGVTFRLKLIDFWDWGRPSKAKQQQDVRDAVSVLHDLIGGRRYYAAAPPEVKRICAGLRRGLILKRFPTMSALRRHLESFEWPG